MLRSNRRLDRFMSIKRRIDEDKAGFDIVREDQAAQDCQLRVLTKVRWNTRDLR